MMGIREYGCNLCDFKLPGGREGHFYVANDAGERVPCARNEESGTIARVLGIDEEVITSCAWNPAIQAGPGGPHGREDRIYIPLRLSQLPFPLWSRPEAGFEEMPCLR